MIRVLPTEVVNQIAAGEVVERPFSVVKELVENSLDAGATRVSVELGDGGRSLIRVRDDGCGMPAADLALAFASHATSKLGSADDLQHIASLGFRGEALASIGSVARCRIQSRTQDQDSGHEVTNDGGTLSDVRPAGCPAGTLIEVRDLFFNVPARRHFLRTPHAERARIQDLLVRLALARLEVDFTLLADGKPVLRLPAGEDLRGRIARAYGRQLADRLLVVQRDSGGYRVTGLAAHPDAARRDSTLECLWINGRAAKERGVAAAVRQAYREFLLPGQCPVWFLLLALPPADVDVNVHPQKAEVRFREARRVAGLLHDAVHSTLRHEAGGSGRTLAGAEHLPAAHSGFPALPADLFGRPVAPLVQLPAMPTGTASVREATASAAWSSPPLPPAAPAVSPPHPFRTVQAKRFLQVAGLYLVVEVDAGILVVDQHALHERVLYEQLRARAADRPVKVQRLLVPDVLELTATDKAWLLEAREVLAGEGLLVEDFGDQAVAISGVPALLSKARPAKLVEALLRGNGDEDPRPRARAAIQERFHSMACRGAVMSGDTLNEAEIEALLLAAAQLEHPHNCPHGRPTVLTFTRGELERFFRRRT